jgi:hypothetical protein
MCSLHVPPRGSTFAALNANTYLSTLRNYAIIRFARMYGGLDGRITKLALVAFGGRERDSGRLSYGRFVAHVVIARADDPGVCYRLRSLRRVCLLVISLAITAGSLHRRSALPGLAS